MYEILMCVMKMYVCVCIINISNINNVYNILILNILMCNNGNININMCVMKWY